MSHPQYSTGQSGIPQQPQQSESQYPYHEYHQPKPQKRGMSRLAVALFVVAALILGSAVMVYGYKKFGPDTGVAVCKAIAEDGKVGGKKNDPNNKLTEKEYKKIREAFSDSRDEEIRRHGTALIDAFWQVSNLKDGEEMGALMFIGTITSSYSGLAGACAKHGVSIPPMSSLNGDK